MLEVDTTNLCSLLQKKLLEEEGEYRRIWLAMQDDPELTAVVRSRQLHIYFLRSTQTHRRHISQPQAKKRT